MFPHTVTIFNECLKEDGAFFKSVLYGVLFVKDENTSRNKLGLTNSDTITCYIPKSVKCSKEYREPYMYDELYGDYAKNYYTLKKGDYISFGDVGEDYLDINELKNKTGNVYEIQGISDFNFGKLQSIVISAK